MNSFARHDSWFSRAPLLIPIAAAVALSSYLPACSKRAPVATPVAARPGDSNTASQRPATAAVGDADRERANQITDIDTGYLNHAALAQLHRWYQFYEEPAYGLANQLDILHEDLVLKSRLGRGQGHAAYVERVKQIPTTWRNAHFVQTAKFDVAADGTLELRATIEYLNVGMLPDGAARAATIDYVTTLKPTPGPLPLFASIELTQTTDGPAPRFRSAYADNRLRSLVHYWLSLVENPSRDPEPVREILADGFRLNFSSGAITDFDGVRAWLAGPASQVEASTHVVSELQHEQVSEGMYKLSAVFDWEGRLPNGSHLVARTRHSWTVANDPKERFARIKTMDVEIVVPFGPK